MCRYESFDTFPATPSRRTPSRRLQRRLIDARADVGRLQADAAHWRSEAQSLLQGLGMAIDRQFAQWGLSAAEREVGLLLLKGLALKDIAEARGTSERTVRQQALTVYRKAGVAGRAELSAFFLEDPGRCQRIRSTGRCPREGVKGLVTTPRPLRIV